MTVLFADEVSFREWQAIRKERELNYNLEVWEFQNSKTGKLALGVFSKGKQKFFDREDYTPLLQKFLTWKGCASLFSEAFK